MHYLYSLIIVLAFPLAAHTDDLKHGLCSHSEGIECEKTLMNQLSSWEYDQESEYLSIRNSCMGNKNAICVKSLFGYIPSWDRDELSEVISIASSCKYNNKSCLDYITNNLANFEYDTIEEVILIGNACKNSSAHCIKRLCSTNNYNCKRSEQLIKAANTCKVSCN
jgi:hypothetical protein